MEKIIQANEAKLKTATVEVKALTISGKQMTLSVFRQLKDEDVLDSETAELQGEPWGTVNYFWKDCHSWSFSNGQNSGEHLHVIWQKGDELRRSAAFPWPHGDTFTELLVSFTTLDVVASRLGLVEHGDPDGTGNRYWRGIYEQGLGKEPAFIDGLADVQASWPEAFADEETLLTLRSDYKQQINSFRSRWIGNYRRLAALEHLFIAV